MISTKLNGQEDVPATLPYHSIESYPESYTMATAVSRMIDGLGYRYYWATEGLTDEDLIFRPDETARSIIEVLEHIQQLCDVVIKTVEGNVIIRGEEEESMSYEDLRSRTLNDLKKASDILRGNPDMDLSKNKLTFKRGEKESSFDFWHLLNGPLEDAIYHTGQIVSFRRTNENPINPLVNVFTGKNRN